MRRSICCMAKDPKVFIIGLGASDAAAIFGSTKGLVEKYGPKRVARHAGRRKRHYRHSIGCCVTRHAACDDAFRLEFAMLSIDQIVNQAANGTTCSAARPPCRWSSAWCGSRMGAGCAAFAKLAAWFAHVPGLKVVMPATPL